MSRRHYNLPPLTTLSAFEAAARHLSFKNAAQELSVTPGAVSHQIKALEEELGAALFHRQHRGVGLTVDGQALFETLAASFGRISRRLDHIRQHDTVEKLTVGSTTAVAALWLSPAIIKFWKTVPDLNINQMTQYTPFQPQANLDFVIRYGRDRDTKRPHTTLFRDSLVPVGPTDMAGTHSNVSLADLAGQRLIHLDGHGRDWTTWTEWFRQLGYDGEINSGTRVTNYAVALQMASQGAGIALGWKRLVQPMLTSGDIAILGSHRIPAPREFYLVDYTEDGLSPNATLFKRWIIDEVPEPMD